MNRYLLFFILLTFMAFKPVNKELSTPEIIKQVFDLAKEGYDKRNSKPLIKAAKILIENPEIQIIMTESETDDYEPSKEESILDSHNFFNPAELLQDAKKFAPYDAKMLRRKIKKLEKKLPRYQRMSLNHKKIKVKNYLIYANNSKVISMAFNKNQKIKMLIRIGKNLKFKVKDSTLKRNMGNSKGDDDTQWLSFTAKSNGTHEITIENTSDESLDCYLMIEIN